MNAQQPPARAPLSWQQRTPPSPTCPRSMKDCAMDFCACSRPSGRLRVVPDGRDAACGRNVSLSASKAWLWRPRPMPGWMKGRTMWARSRLSCCGKAARMRALPHEHGQLSRQAEIGACLRRRALHHDLADALSSTAPIKSCISPTNGCSFRAGCSRSGCSPVELQSARKITKRSCASVALKQARLAGADRDGEAHSTGSGCGMDGRLCAGAAGLSPARRRLAARPAGHGGGHSHLSPLHC